MKVYDLGTIPWKDTQLIYHTLARMKTEALVLHSCDEPYVCVGFPHNPRDDLDLEYCRSNNIPIFRREIGGGNVLLDRNQIFINLIVRRTNPLAPRSQVPFFRKFLGPVIGTYRDLGIPVEYKPINDLVVNGRKISGTGGGEIDDSLVMATNILLDFDYDLMSRILNVPNEAFREKVLESMKVHLTTVRKELGSVPSREMIKELIVSHYTEMFGDLEKGDMTRDILDAKDEVEKQLMNDTWLFKRGIKQIGRDVKIIEGVNVISREYSIDGKTIELVLEVINKSIAQMSVFRDGIPLVHELFEKDLLDEEFEESKMKHAVETHLMNPCTLLSHCGSRN